MSDHRMIQNAAVGYDCVINLRTVDLRAGQKSWAAENRRAHVKKIEAGQFAADIQVCFEEGANGSDVLPIALKNRGEHAQIFNRLRDDVFAEIGQRIVEQL